MYHNSLPNHLLMGMVPWNSNPTWLTIQLSFPLEGQLISISNCLKFKGTFPPIRTSTLSFACCFSSSSSSLSSLLLLNFLFYWMTSLFFPFSFLVPIILFMLRLLKSISKKRARERFGYKTVQVSNEGERKFCLLTELKAKKEKKMVGIE